MMLAAEQHLHRWSDRNRQHGLAISNYCQPTNIRADLEASIQIARWSYSQAFIAGSMAWVNGKELQAIKENWERVL